MIKLNSLLRELSNSVGIGCVDTVTSVIEKYIPKQAKVTYNGNSIVCALDNGSKKTILFEAHKDEVGMIVTDVDDFGFLSVAAVGGIDIRTLPASKVIIHGDKAYVGVFCTTPPHLSKDDKLPDSITDMYLDSGLGKQAKEHIKKGDYISYYPVFSEIGDCVSGKSLDNRAGVAALIMLMNSLAEICLPVNVEIAFTDMEELGHRGAKTALYDTKATEAVAVDVTFGNAPDIPAPKCQILGRGGAIGISPVLSSAVTNMLFNLAKENNIPCQTEVMAGRTSTNADDISLIKSGIPTGLVSVPLRNMHTSAEILNVNDINYTIELLKAYAEKGGATSA